MGESLVYIMTLAFVALASRGLLLALTEDARYAGTVTYSVRARRIGRGYRVAAWAILLIALMISLASSFIEVFLKF
jgi:hypothetical protein